MKTAEFLYDPKNGNWTGYVQRHEPGLTPPVDHVYDLCDVAKGTSFHWSRYVEQGFTVSIRTMTTYDEDHAGLAGKPIPKPTAKFNLEIGDNGVWTGRVVNADGDIILDASAVRDINLEFALQWTQWRLGVGGFPLSTMAKVVLGPSGLRSLFDDTFTLSLLHSEKCIRRTKPIEPLTGSFEDYRTFLRNLAKRLSAPQFVAIHSAPDGVPTGRVFDAKTDKEVSHLFQHTPNDRDAFLDRALELGADGMAWSFKTPEEKSSGVTRLHEGDPTDLDADDALLQASVDTFPGAAEEVAWEKQPAHSGVHSPGHGSESPAGSVEAFTAALDGVSKPPTPIEELRELLEGKPVAQQRAGRAQAKSSVQGENSTPEKTGDNKVIIMRHSGLAGVALVRLTYTRVFDVGVKLEGSEGYTKERIDELIKQDLVARQEELLSYAPMDNEEHLSRGDVFHDLLPAGDVELVTIKLK